MTIPPTAKAVRLFDEYEYLMGIDFGAVTSGISIAHKNDCFNIYTIKKWSEGKRGFKTASSQIPTSILYRNCDRNDALIGVLKSDPQVYINENDDIYVEDIKQAAIEGRNPPNLPVNWTIKDVVADYLKDFHQLAIDSLKEDKKSKKTSRFLEKEIEIENIRYCLACPEELTDFMGQCFIQAGIVKEEELEFRLAFVSESDATAYSCIAWTRQSREINADEKHVVCDIGHSALRISNIMVDATEFFSKVTSIFEDSALGSVTLENTLRNYLNLQENFENLKLNRAIIEALLQEFTSILKFSFDCYMISDLKQDDNDSIDGSDGRSNIASTLFTTTNTEGNPINITNIDLNQHVFSPYIENVIQRILEVNGTKIFLSGKFAHSSYFLEKFGEKNGGKLKNSIRLVIDHDLGQNSAPKDNVSAQDLVSRGAVSHGMRKKSAQIPYYVGTKTSSEERVEEPGLRVDRKGQSDGSKCDYIVGIDFGTTYSGCSYARLGDDSKDAIKTITSGWGGVDNHGLGKTPTLLVYDIIKRKTDSKKWGQAAKDDIGDLKNSELLFDKFKLFLSRENSEGYYGGGHKELNQIYEKNNGYYGSTDSSKDDYNSINYGIVDAIADYLKYFKKHVDSAIMKEEKNGESKQKINYVLTVPAMWDASAREKMAKAAISAGIVTKEQISNLLIITEPEAAALYCENKYKDFVMEDGKTFIVCDAGGGTVDLVTFRLIKNSKGELSICQVGDGDGDFCGSTYLDEKFKDYLLKFYDDVGYQYDVCKLDFSDIMKKFETSWKTNFMPRDDDKNYKIDLPSPGIPSNYVSHQLTDNNKTLLMSNKDMKNKVFDPIMIRIEKLLQKQIDKSDVKIDTILMVGGFSKSKYLQSRLKRSFEPHTTIGIPAEGVRAISYGAVSYALNPRMITRRLAAQSYALEVKSKFEKEKGDDIRKQVESGDIIYSDSRLEYFVKKDDQIEKENNFIYEKYVDVEYPNNALIAIFSCDAVADENDHYWRYPNPEHVKIMELNIDMPKVSIKDMKKKIPFKVSLRIDHIGVTVQVKCLDALMGKKVMGIAEDGSALVHVRKSDPTLVKNDKILVNTKWNKFKVWFGF